MILQQLFVIQITRTTRNANIHHFRPDSQILRDKVCGICTLSRPKAARQTRATINAWPKKHFYLSMLVFTFLVVSRLVIVGYFESYIAMLCF